MRKTLLCFVMVSCTSPEPTEGIAQAEGESCQTPPVRCYPFEDGGRFCALACGNILSYCPDYPDSAYIYCRTRPRPYSDSCDSFGEPSYAMHCLLGAPATPPPPESERIRTLRAARRLAEHGQNEQARELFARFRIQL
jgi:hypothetical protein